MNITLQKTPFTELPGTSALFADYLSAPERLAAFFPGFDAHTVTIENLSAIAPRVAAAHPHRDGLCDTLAEQNLKWGAEAATLDAIERLRDAASVAVVGGQQVGLFGGPALSFHKAVTVIKIADELTKRGTPAVPVFWMATEDHDFEEVAQTAVLSRDGGRVEITVPATGEGKPPVGSLHFSAELEGAFEVLAAALPETEFTPDVLADLRTAYAPGATWGDAFAVRMLKLLSRFGLVVVDPRDERLKHLARPVHQAAIERAEEFATRLGHRSQALAAEGYHAQVAVAEHSTLLFLDIDGTRTSLVRDGEAFVAKNDATRRFSIADLLEIVENDPLRLSPNALLRPVAQDAVFPTVAQVLGPAEIAYLAQSQVIYDALDRPAPVRWHRSGATFIEARHAKTLEKYGFTATDMLAGASELIRRAVLDSPAGATVRTFVEAKAAFNAHLDVLHQSLTASDPPLADALQRGRDKILNQIDGLENRFVANRAQAEEAMRRQIERAVTAIAPRGALQERDLNITTFLARYGPALIEAYFDLVTVDPHHHQWLTIG